jgi:hypothetical protein
VCLADENIIYFYTLHTITYIIFVKIIDGDFYVCMDKYRKNIEDHAL